MTGTDLLLQKFLNEGLSSINEVKAQNDALQKDMTDLKISVSTISEQLVNVSRTLSAGHARLERDGVDLRRKWEESQKLIAELEKRIIAMESKQDTGKLNRIEGDVIEVSKRIGKVESQQNKWLGGLAVVGIIVGFIISILLQATKALWS